MNHASLFSGIGGFDLAAEWMGWTNVLHVERDPFCQRVLAHHFPNSQPFDNVTTFDGRPWRGRVDILTGGFPCQPYSTAGKRLGKDDERHLWPEMRRIISEIAPTFVVGENVRGLTNWNGGLVFEEVCADLEALGYEVWTGIIPAAGVGAPHRRDRVWFVAKNAVRGGCLHGGPDQEGADLWQQRDAGSRGADRLYLSTGNAANTDGSTKGTPRESGSIESNRSAEGIQQGEWGDEAEQHNRPSSILRYAPNSECDGLEHGKERGGARSSEGKARGRASGYASAESWAGFPTQPPVCGGDDGISRQLDGITFPKWRNESIKAYGNAIVPQVAFQIFTAINQTL